MADGELIGCHCLFTLLRPHNSNLISEDEEFLLLLLLLFCYTLRCGRARLGGRCPRVIMSQAIRRPFINRVNILVTIPAAAAPRPPAAKTFRSLQIRSMRLLYVYIYVYRTRVASYWPAGSAGALFSCGRRRSLLIGKRLAAVRLVSTAFSSLIDT